MAIFEDISLDWKGVTYTLRGDQHIMRALAAVEDHITIAELVAGQSGRIPLAKLASAYTAMLHVAGARHLTNAEVYAGMWEGGINQEAINEAINGLLSTMMPPNYEPEQDQEQPAPKAKKPQPRKASSKAPTKRG